MKRVLLLTAILLTCIPAVSTAAVIGRPANNLGLVGYWSFNEGRGTSATDFSGKRNTGSIMNSPAWVDGKFGKALSFDGSSQYVDLGKPATLDMSGAMTMSAWVKVTDVSLTYSGGVDIISSYNAAGTNAQYEMSITNGEVGYSTVNGGVNTGNSTTNTPITENNHWYHIVITRNNTGGDRSGDTLTVYVDGVAQPQTIPTAIPPSQSAAGNAVIGRDGDIPSGYYFPGVIDEVRIYNRELSSSEVAALYKSGGAVGGSTASFGAGTLRNGLVGYWTMDGIDVTDKVYDKSGRGNNGYVYGASTTTIKTLGRLGQAARFTGAPRVRIDQTSGLPLYSTDTSYSYSMWIKGPPQTNGNFFIEDNSGGTAFMGLSSDSAGNTGKLEFFVFNNAGSTVMDAKSNGTPLDNTWHHLVWADNNGTATLYIDGAVDAGISNYTRSGAYTMNRLTMGALFDGSFAFTGLMDDIRMYDRVLTAAEAKQLYVLGSQSVGASSKKLGVGAAAGSLVGHWTMDGTDVTDKVYDMSGNGGHGYLTSGATSTAKTLGKLGQAIRFNGSNGIKIPAGVFNGMSAFTACFWVYPQSSIQDSDVFVTNYKSDSTSGWDVYFVSTGSATRGGLGTSFGTGGSYTYLQDGTDVITFNEWNFVCAVQNGDLASSMRRYVNGVDVGGINTEAGSRASDAGNAMNIGIDINLSASAMPGSMDDVRIYSRVLTASEIKQLYNLGR